VFIWHGAKHDWYQNPRTKMTQACRATARPASSSRAAFLQRGDISEALRYAARLASDETFELAR
jgi:hypothetical protein